MDTSFRVIKHIDENFCYIRYYDIDTIMMKANGYINATKICNSGNKRFRDWYSLQSSKDIMKNITCEKYDKVTIDIGLSPSGGIYRYEVVGTYVHRSLAPHIVSWTFPAFAIKFSQIVNTYYALDEKLSGINIKGDSNEFIKIVCRMLDRDMEELRERIKKIEEKYDKEFKDTHFTIISSKKHSKRLQYQMNALESKLNNLLESFNN